jgi:hypothetical protein
MGLLNAVHSAWVEEFKGPETDRNQRIHEYSEQDFEKPPGRTDKYTLVEICAFPGRSAQTKKNLYSSIVTKLGRLGIEPMDVFIVLYEPPMENWGIRGGIPANEVDLGFEVKV